MSPLPEVTWGILIALYLYLGGMAGGMWMFAFAADYVDKKSEKYYPAAKTAAYLAPLILIVGIAALVLDLSRPSVPPKGLLHILNVFNNPTSIMTIGSVIISAAAIIGLITAVMYFANASRIWRLVFSFISAILGFGTAAYTGILLSFARDVPLWDSGWLSWLFVTSGVSSGIAATIIATRILGSFTPDYILPEFKAIRDKWIEIAETLHRYDIYVMWMELAMLIGWIVTIYARYGSLPLSWLTTGIAGAAFWAYIVLGWIVPVAMYYTLKGTKTILKVNIYLGAILIAVFAFALRFAVLYAPQLAELAAGLPLH